MNIVIPGRVWEDFLSPSISGMEKELGLTPLQATPFRVKRGKGEQFCYDNVPDEIVLDLASYLFDRGDTLLGQGIVDPYDSFEKAERDMLRRACKLGEELRKAVQS